MITFSRTSWQDLPRHWSKDIQLLLFIVAYFFINRLVLFLLFNDRMSSGLDLGDVLQAFAMGLRYDIGGAAPWILCSFVSSILLVWFGANLLINRIRQWQLVAFCVVGVFVLIINIVYFYQYSDQYNQIMFGLLTDDTVAILKLVWNEFRPVLFGLMYIICVISSIWLAGKWMNKQIPGVAMLATYRPGVMGRVFVIPFALALFLLAARGGDVYGRPLVMLDAFVTKDAVLNRIVPNPLTALRETVVTRMEMKSVQPFEKYWPGGKVSEAASVAFPESKTLAANRLSDIMQKQARPVNTLAIRHIFVLLIESHSGWPVHPGYRQLNLSPELGRLADEGIYFKNFLHSGYRTIGTLNSLISGLPYLELSMHYEPQSTRPYETGLIYNLRKLGYYSRFYYGGSTSWQRIDQFLPAQGFDEVLGHGIAPDAPASNDWGIDDEYLYDAILQTELGDKPSVNVILSTSNHDPYEMDLQSKGLTPVENLPENIKVNKNKTARALAHLEYSDLQLSRFVRQMEKKYPGSLFVITGDHTQMLGLGFPGSNAFEHVAVPLVLYGKGILEGIEYDPLIAGSHIDIAPTIYDLVAKTGFSYASFGKSMFQKSSEDIGLGYKDIIGRDFLISQNPNNNNVYPLPGQNSSRLVEDISAIKRQAHAMKALARYRIQHGDSYSSD